MEPAEYQRLKAVWDKKLKKSGFVDIESENGMLKRWSIKFILDAKRPSVLYRDEYYRYASHYLFEYKFKCRQDKQIWRFHTEGYSLRETAAKMGLKFDQVRRVVDKVKASLFESIKRQANDA